MKLPTLLLVLIQIKYNYAFYDLWPNNMFGIHKYNLHLSSVDIKEKCNATDVYHKKCIWKCCPEGQVMGIFKSCEISNVTFNNITVYDFQHVNTNKSLESVFELVPFLLNDTTFAKNSLWWFRKAYLRKDGQLFLKFPNVYNRWKEIEINHFCVDMKINGSIARPVFMVEYDIEHRRPISETKKWGLLVSAISVCIVLFVYAILPQLRDFNGILLMLNFFCLIVTFVTHCALDMNFNLRMSGILTLTFIHYFFKMSSYCWMNVMFYQILMSRDANPTDSWAKQILKCCGYAFGLPLFMTIMVATIEITDMSDTPSFVTPQIQNKGNFSFQEIESVYYLYIPIFIILSLNWLVCFIKVVQFCNSSQRLAVVLTNDEPQPLNRPMQIVKLLAALTLYALLEMLYVLCFLRSNDYVSIYSLCIGPLTLIIFVWNQNVRLLLVEKMQVIQKKSTSTSNLAAFFHRREDDTNGHIDLPHLRS